jgi:hypothetical protein
MDAEHRNGPHAGKMNAAPLIDTGILALVDGPVDWFPSTLKPFFLIDSSE